MEYSNNTHNKSIQSDLSFAKFSHNPARAIVGMRIMPEPKTMALGGVAASSIQTESTTANEQDSPGDFDGSFPVD